MDILNEHCEGALKEHRFSLFCLEVLVQGLSAAIMLTDSVEYQVTCSTSLQT
jgi:hypothetical protein